MTESDAPILLSEDGEGDNAGIRTLALNRPHRRNALSPELVEALNAALKSADNDTAVRALVLTGTGDKAFCAGGDLGAPRGDGFLAMHHDRGAFADLLCTFRALRTPTVAAVQAGALGGGFGLVLACDFAVTHNANKLGTPEVRRGLFPMMIGRLIYETLPRRAASRLVLLGETLNGEQAKELDVVSTVVATAADVMPAAMELAQRLAAQSPAALALGRPAMYRQQDMPHDVALSYLRDQLSLNLMTEDAAEGISSFFEKRDPKWTGR